MLRLPNAALRFRPEAAAGGAAARRRGSRAAGGMRGAAAARRGRRHGARRGRGAAGGGQRPGAAAGGARNARTVYVLEGGAPVPRQVQTGLSDGSFTEIAGGELREGEPVIVGFAPGTAGAAAHGRGRGPRGGFRIL